MDLNEFGPILTLMAQQEERFIDKMNKIHTDVMETKAQTKLTNGRVTELEKKDLIRTYKNRNIVLKMAGMVLAAAVLAAVIMNVGILEFLKWIK